MTGLVGRTGGSLRLVRTAIELSVLTAGWLLGGSVGVGTVCYAIGIGPLVHVALPRLQVRPSAAAMEGDATASAARRTSAGPTAYANPGSAGSEPEPCEP
jgi:uncharacterized membrane protein YczE